MKLRYWCWGIYGEQTSGTCPDPTTGYAFGADFILLGESGFATYGSGEVVFEVTLTEYISNSDDDEAGANINTTCVSQWVDPVAEGYSLTTHGQDAVKTWFRWVIADSKWQFSQTSSSGPWVDMSSDQPKVAWWYLSPGMFSSITQDAQDATSWQGSLTNLCDFNGATHESERACAYIEVFRD